MDADAIDKAPDAAAAWPDQIYGLLKKHDIRQVALVPDAGHSRLIKRCLADNEIQVTTLTTEEEGIALMQGAWLGGQKAVLLMQSSGVGNCINMLSLSHIHRCPMPMLVTMRGDFGEFNPAQIPMGNATQAVLEAMGTLVKRADTPEDIAPTVDATIRLAFNTFRPTATLIGQRVIGAKTFGKD
ncbi:thiamine pyrophosphate-binding protein [Neoroseomonas oryzicola]|uniref:Phosphonopyruvate decarboxylase n=1 Tax=Neoroseomonas oryzicola TaxID=535904 RepID=A0A9X9WI49_9PROT|nr:thiamine pyrophosphate-binding protein [Neoroseomonas oryzicola]MBR0660009.1 phosphonopyruvate decarboxylase [Neoroseomonas oryzicola]NKE19438.1 phosphonopyruvate decarboxylase [Neoroseomonas oryzicola]